MTYTFAVTPVTVIWQYNEIHQAPLGRFDEGVKPTISVELWGGRNGSRGGAV